MPHMYSFFFETCPANIFGHSHDGGVTAANCAGRLTAAEAATGGGSGSPGAGRRPAAVSVVRWLLQQTRQRGGGRRAEVAASSNAGCPTAARKAKGHIPAFMRQ